MYCTKCGRQLEDGEICTCTNQQPEAQPLSAPNQPKKKKMTKGKIAAIIVISAVASFIIFFGIGFLLGNLLTPADSSEILEQIEAQYPDKNFIAESSVTVSHGSITNGIYKNDWLNLQLDCPDGYFEADQPMYKDYSVEGSECVLYFIAEDADEISILIGDGSYTTPKEYAAYYHASLIPILEDQYSEAYGEEIGMKNIFDSVTIGGIEYLVSVTYADIKAGGVVYCLLCTQLDGQLVEITIITDTLDECTALINSLKSLRVKV